MHDVIWYGGLAGFGVLLGLATLPWAYRADRECRPWLWVLTWACFWPLLVAFTAWEGIKAYRKAWWNYADRVRSAKHRAQGEVTEDGIGGTIIAMQQTTKDTYHQPR